MAVACCVQNHNLGQNLAVLRGHTSPITRVSFHPRLPLALLSAAADNTVRLWDASDQHFAPMVLRPAQPAVRQPAEREELGPLAASASAAAIAAAAAQAMNAGAYGMGIGQQDDIDSEVGLGSLGSLGLEITFLR
jgi:hypothetical protein